MKFSLKAFFFVSLLSMFILTAAPKQSQACYVPLSGLICTGGALLSAVATMVSFIPGAHSQEQFCNYGNSSSCCAAPASNGPSVPNNCTSYQQSAAVCPGSTTLFCPGANVPASTGYQTWAKAVGTVGALGTFAFSVAATAIFSMPN